MHEPITVEVGGDPGDGTYRWQNVMFTGHLVQVSQSGYTTTSLYEWLDRGYLVYVEEDRPGSVPRRTLYPLDALDALTYPAEATPQKGYTAEEVARAYPELTHEVGLPLERD